MRRRFVRQLDREPRIIHGCGANIKTACRLFSEGAEASLRERPHCSPGAQPLFALVWVLICPVSGSSDAGYRQMRRIARRVLTPAHAVKEFAVILRGLEFAEQKFSGFKFIHRIKQFSQYPYLLQNILFH
jgi:hypothetical protein